MKKLENCPEKENLKKKCRSGHFYAGYLTTNKATCKVS